MAGKISSASTQCGQEAAYVCSYNDEHTQCSKNVLPDGTCESWYRSILRNLWEHLGSKQIIDAGTIVPADEVVRAVLVGEGRGEAVFLQNLRGQINVPAALCALPTGYSWSNLACKMRHLVCIRQPYIGSSFQQ
jgi:hypothetical protein